MRNLLWKDYRQNRGVLLAVVIIAVGPYVAALVITAFRALFWPPGQRAWMEGIQQASRVGLIVSAVLTAFMGGNAIAGERADRSAEFAAGLPIHRPESILSKALIALIPCLFLWALSAVANLCSALEGKLTTSGDLELMLATLLCLILFFGLSWMFSALLRSPVISAAAAIGAAVALSLGGATLRNTVAPEPLDNIQVIALLVLPVTVGFLSFLTGTLICLRRQEP